MTGPDPREDSTCRWGATVYMTIKVKVEISTCNRDQEDDRDEAVEDLTLILEKHGYAPEFDEVTLEANT